MTRLEAFQALFGNEADKTASQEAVDVLGNHPEPTPDEAADMDADVLDRANMFCDNPAFEAKRMPAGPAKAVLVAFALSLQNQVQPVAVDLKPDHVTRDPEPAKEPDMGRNRNNGNQDNWNKQGDHSGGGNKNHNQNGRGGKGNQGQNHPQVEATKPSSWKSSADERQIMETDAWHTDRAHAEKLFARIRSGDQTSVHDLEKWKKVLFKIRDSTSIDPNFKKHTLFLLKLLNALRDRVDEVDKPGYKERFIDGQPPPPTDPYNENPQLQGQGNRFVHPRR